MCAVGAAGAMAAPAPCQPPQRVTAPRKAVVHPVGVRISPPSPLAAPPAPALACPPPVLRPMLDTVTAARVTWHSLTPFPCGPAQQPLGMSCSGSIPVLTASSFPSHQVLITTLLHNTGNGCNSPGPAVSPGLPRGCHGGAVLALLGEGGLCCQLQGVLQTPITPGVS